MVETKTIELNNKQAEGILINTGNVNAILIKAEKGCLACAYFDINIANKVGDAMAIVTGVKTFDDCLNAKVIKASDKAKELGVKEDMTGKEALLLMS
jgi:uncharacterized protein YunC (DUF1805 family)